MERVIDSACEEVLACKTPKTIEIELAPLVFHQDQWENIPYEYLYFQVIDLNGFTEHYSLLGRVKEEVSGTHKNKYSTKSYELADLEEAPIRLKCVPGSGYGVKQLDPIVHSRTFARTLVSNIYDEEKCREYGFNEAEGRQLCVKYSNPLPARLVFVVRIS